MVAPAGYPAAFSSFRDTNVTGYTGGFVQIDLGSLPPGDYSVHVVVAAEVASGVSAPDTRDLFCVLDTIPASPLALTAQMTFPSLHSNGNAFAQMPMLATLSAAGALTVRLRCEVSPTTNAPDLRLTSTMVATATAPVVQV